MMLNRGILTFSRLCRPVLDEKAPQSKSCAANASPAVAAEIAWETPRSNARAYASAGIRAQAPLMVFAGPTRNIASGQEASSISDYSSFVD
jgi:hypothetical protein